MNVKHLKFIRSQYTDAEYVKVKKAANGVPMASYQKYLVMERANEVLRRGQND